MNFSVLISIYHKEKPEFFNRCMKSIWNEQLVKPSQIVLVKDGPLTSELDKSIDSWKSQLSSVLKVIVLPTNQGLGNALNIGLKGCDHDIIARMDTDDIAIPDRFLKQLKVMEKYKVNICSSWVGEFSDNPDDIIALRKVPETHEEIITYVKRRSPINHPAVMFEKQAVIDAGGYQDMTSFEDYYLWARMIVKGAKFYNLQEVLVNMSAGYEQLERRGGVNYARSEISFQRALYRLGFTNFCEYIFNLFTRTAVRLLPKSILKLIYKLLRD